jgi:uncharacterized protein with HEPN domain
MSKRNNFLLLNDIIEAISNIEFFLKDITEDQFYTHLKTKHAVVRNLEIIGEAAVAANLTILNHEKAHKKYFYHFTYLTFIWIFVSNIKYLFFLGQ